MYYCLEKCIIGNHVSTGRKHKLIPFTNCKWEIFSQLCLNYIRPNEVNQTILKANASFGQIIVILMDSMESKIQHTSGNHRNYGLNSVEQTLTPSSSSPSC